MVRDAEIGDPTAKEVLKCIADQSNDAGTGVWSSIDYFRWSTERSRSTVKRALEYLRENEFIMPDGTSKYGTNRWVINTAKLQDLKREWRSPVDKNDRVTVDPQGQSEPSGRVTVDLPQGQSEPLTPIEPSTISESAEIEYIDDVGGVPDERQIEWYAFLEGWRKCFPNKSQPLKSNTTLRNKFYTRLKDEGFRAKWREALWVSKDKQYLHDDGWFKAKWFVHNNDNYEKLLDGTFSFKEKGQQVTQPAQPPAQVHVTPTEINNWRNRRTK
jgi:hypothetical protein